MPRMAVRNAGGWRGGTGCLALFALPFAAGGIFMLCRTGRDLRDAHRMARWQEVPAVVESVESVRSGKTTATHATYRYEVDGRPYTGTRVGIDTGGDNVGSFQTRAYQELKRFQSARKPFRCFVDPEDPAQAILYREARWEMLLLQGLFGLVFGGVGFGLLIGAVYAGRSRRRELAAQTARPQEPWLWNRSWDGGTVRDDNRVTMWFALGFALFWNAISTPAAIFALRDYAVHHNPAVGVALIFPAVGFGLAIWAARTVWKRVAFGTSTFRLSQVPGVIGGTLRGTVEIPVHIQPADGYRVTLRCVNRVTTGSGKSRHTTESVLWEDERLQAHEVQDGNPAHALLPVLFAVPRACRPTATENSDDQILWRLQVEAPSARGPRYSSRFEVPMFVTPDSVDDVRPDEGAPERYGHKLRPDEATRESGVRVETQPGGGVRYTCPAARYKGSACVLTLFCAIWSGVIYGLLHYHAPRLFPIVFALFDIAVAWGVLSAWFDWRRIEIAPDGVRISGGIFGLAGLRRLDRGTIAAIDVRAGSTQGDRSFFSLKVTTAGGGSHTAGNGILGRHAAEVIAADIRVRLGLPAATS